MGEQFGILLTYAGAVILIFIVGKIFLWPLKLVLKLVLNSIAGGLIILILYLQLTRAHTPGRLAISTHASFSSRTYVQ